MIFYRLINILFPMPEKGILLWNLEPRRNLEQAIRVFAEEQNLSIYAFDYKPEKLSKGYREQVGSRVTPLIEEEKEVGKLYESEITEKADYVSDNLKESLPEILYTFDDRSTLIGHIADINVRPVIVGRKFFDLDDIKMSSRLKAINGWTRRTLKQAIGNADEVVTTSEGLARKISDFSDVDEVVVSDLYLDSDDASPGPIQGSILAVDFERNADVMAASRAAKMNSESIVFSDVFENMTQTTQLKLRNSHYQENLSKNGNTNISEFSNQLASAKAVLFPRRELSYEPWLELVLSSGTPIIVPNESYYQEKLNYNNSKGQKFFGYAYDPKNLNSITDVVSKFDKEDFDSNEIISQAEKMFKKPEDHKAAK